MSKMYSQHNFMFPLRWDILPKGFELTNIKENIPLDERTNLNFIPDQFGKWNRKQYKLKCDDGVINGTSYSEFAYFHEFVNKAIFDYDYPWKKKKQCIAKYFEFDINKSLKNIYEIEIIDFNGNIETIKLVIEGITFHIFNTGVGVITYDLSNKDENQKSKETILKINEYGRRIYPQFLNSKGVIGTKEKFLANKLSLTINSIPFSVDDFTWYNKYSANPTVSEPYCLPNLITNLFEELFIFRLDKVKALDQPQILITKVTDDRMFFHSWIGDKVETRRIARHFKKNQFVESDWWYAYIFGDKAINDSIANRTMKLKLIDEHTYQRWAEYGTLYGMTRDSFVCLTDEGDFAEVLRMHMQSMYYTISVLCLAQRATILKFTTEVANIADLAQIKDDDRVIKNIKELYRNYIEFINKLYFREITPQIQGIEIYTQFQKLLNIKEEVNDLDNEISELHEFVRLLQGEKGNKQAEKLNLIAFILLPATLMFGILGANIYGDTLPITKEMDVTAWWWILIGLVPSILILVLYYLKTMIKKWK